MLVTMACGFKGAAGVLLQALHQHEEDLLVVLGNVPLDGFHLGSFLDACTLAPSPQATLQNSQRLLQVTIAHFKGCRHSISSAFAAKRLPCMGARSCVCQTCETYLHSLQTGAC